MVEHRCGWLLIAALIGSMTACGGGDAKRDVRPGTGVAGSTRPSGNGACALMMQSEVDELFGTSVGAGAAESLGGDTEICMWPAGEDAALLLQISPASDDIKNAVDLGEGFRVAEVAGMSGPAAAALEQADGDQFVAVIAMTAGERSITLSPIGLGVLAGTPSFETLKAVVDKIASRL